MAMGWKPRLASQTYEQEQSNSVAPSLVTKIPRIVRSSSAELLSRFSPDTSPDTDEKTPRRELERNLDLRARVMKELPFRRSRSADPTGDPDVTLGAASGTEEVVVGLAGNLPQDVQVPSHRVLHSEPESKRRMVFDEVKNKPLPKIAML
jgi:hypothetical protein